MERWTHSTLTLWQSSPSQPGRWRELFKTTGCSQTSVKTHSSTGVTHVSCVKSGRTTSFQIWVWETRCKSYYRSGIDREIVTLTHLHCWTSPRTHPSLA